jgi:hypothetical protein
MLAKLDLLPVAPDAGFFLSDANAKPNALGGPKATAAEAAE